MKTFVYLIVTVFISVGSFMTAFNQKASTIPYVIAFGVWGLFFWEWYSRSKKVH
jgi:hypothetical protein